MFHYTKGKELGFPALAELHYKNLRMERVTKKATKRYVGSILNAVDQAAVDKGGQDHVFFTDLALNDYRWLKEIIVATPAKLQDIITLFETRVAIGSYPPLKEIIDGKTVDTAFATLIKAVFDYDCFSGLSARYGAYDFCLPMGMDVCPYCNRNYTLTVYYRGNGLIRPELDHFVPKSKYPYLALSFYNLIPSCHLCNSNLKHAKPMNFKDFLHPYEHSLHEILRFTAEFRNKKEMTADEVINTFGVDFFAGKTDSFEVKVKFRKGIPFSLVKKAARNVKIFKLQKIYNEHKDLVEEMVAGATVFSETHIDTIYQGFQGSLFSSREDVIRLLTNNFAATDDMHKRPFSKLTKDIYAEFGIQYSTL